MLAFAVANDPHCCACLGDSITANASGYVTKLQTRYQPARVIKNHGISGYRSDHVYSLVWTPSVKTGGYRQISLMVGINDIVQGVSAATINANLDLIYDEALARSMHVVAITVSPFGNYASWTSGLQTVLETVNSHIATKVAANPSMMRLIDAYAFMGDSDATKLKAAYDNGDGLHWNEAGHTAFEQQFYASF